MEDTTTTESTDVEEPKTDGEEAAGEKCEKCEHDTHEGKCDKCDCEK